MVNEVRELTGQDPYTVPMDIYTSMDSKAQQLAYNISNGEVYSFPNQYFNIGLTLVDNDSGEIVAIGPGRQYVGDSTSRNAATELQQPGSTMKPILDYAPTFDLLGWSTTHTVDDRADDYFHIGRDLQNSDGLYMGEITLADVFRSFPQHPCRRGAARADRFPRQQLLGAVPEGPRLYRQRGGRL